MNENSTKATKGESQIVDRLRHLAQKEVAVPTKFLREAADEIVRLRGLLEEMAGTMIGTRRIIDGPGAYWPEGYSYDDVYRAHGLLEKIADAI